LRAGPARRLSYDRRAELWRRLVTDTMLGWLRDGEIGRAEEYAREQIQVLSAEF
jgi:hypothetical protein